MNVHLLGIRHHGVGSALRVKQALQALQPDLILIEGPQEFDAVIKHISAGAITPPVAILGYNADNPHQATFYPFAEFSPEWQALRFAEKHRIPTRMMDLPLRFTFQISENKGAVPARDPMSYLAEIEGFTNSEAWWESRFESSENEDNSDGHFDAVQMAMTALREAQLPSVLDEENLLREAWMRECLRTAAREMYREVAVVCGAWHVPALVGWSNSATADKAIIKSLPQQKMKIGATWVPWTNERLGLQSGYGAGIQAPGWSQFRWKYQEHTARNWLAAAAAVFRKRNIDISTAHVIDALQLANTLAIFRGRKQPLQTDLNEAITTVMCMGDEILLRWIQTELSVGKAMGEVPGNLPRLPLQIDFENTVKKLRIKLTDEETELVLDLREERNLQKSIFL